MKALKINRGELKLADVQIPSDDSEALVRVLRSGICNTDLEIVRGYAGFQGTIGHEFVGVVEKSNGANALTGKRVVGEINVGCGICELCLSGDPRHCSLRTVLGIHKRDGAHAEFLTLPAKNLLEVPGNVTDEQAVFTEPLAAAYGITEQVQIEPDTKVAVIGDGKVGLLCAMSLALRSKNVSIFGKHALKLAIAAKRNIEGILLEKVNSLTGHFDVVVEASGSESGFATALILVKPRGKIVLKSTYHGLSKWDASQIVVSEITIVGSRCGKLAHALELLAKKKIEVDDLISEEFALEDGLKAMEKAGEKGVLKVLLKMRS
jgi:threonine dehydrogenase-like Zn-dependent dehydrogenase